MLFINLQMDKWAHLLPPYIRYSFSSSQMGHNIGTGTIAVKNEKEHSHVATFDPNNDIIMLRAKVRALEEYVELLIDVVDAYEEEAKTAQKRRFSSPL